MGGNMSKTGRPVKNYLVEMRYSPDFIDGLEKMLNDKYNQGWEFVEILNLKVNEYKILFRKINDLGGSIPKK